MARECIPGSRGGKVSKVGMFRSRGGVPLIGMLDKRCLCPTVRGLTACRSLRRRNLLTELPYGIKARIFYCFPKSNRCAGYRVGGVRVYPDVFKGVYCFTRPITREKHYYECFSGRFKGFLFLAHTRTRGGLRRSEGWVWFWKNAG